MVKRRVSSAWCSGRCRAPTSEAEAKKLAQKVAGLHPLSLAACKVCLRLARDPERNGFAAETEWTGRLLGTGGDQRRVTDFLAGARRDNSLSPFFFRTGRGLR